MDLRLVDVPNEGEFEVPTHVSRVDSGDPRPGGWHGWQVRWPGHRRFFTDAAHGGCAAALAAACRHRDVAYPGKRSQVNPAAGVHLRFQTKKARNSVEVYAEASSPVRGAPAKRVYAGILGSTATEDRIQDALRKARGMRMQMIAEHRERRSRIA